MKDNFLSKQIYTLTIYEVNSIVIYDEDNSGHLFLYIVELCLAPLNVFI